MVKRPSPDRLARASRELNILRENHRNMIDAHDMDQRDCKKYVPDLSETIEMIVQKFRVAFGTTKEELKKKTDFSELAHAKMDASNIGWKVQFAARDKLKKWVKEVMVNKELWAVPENFEAAADEAELADSDQDQGSDEDDDDDDDDDDEDEDEHVPLKEVKQNRKKQRLKFWLENMKPLPKESEDEYSARVMYLLEGGVRDRRQVAASRRAGPSVGPSVEDTAEAGAQAREYYLELMPDRREPKPTKVLRHHDAGPVRGRQYELLWKYPGCGPGKKKWVGPDHMLKYPDLLENYNKVPHHVWYH